MAVRGGVAVSGGGGKKYTDVTAARTADFCAIVIAKWSRATDRHGSSSAINLVRAHTKEDGMTKVTIVGQLHTGDFDDLANQ